MTVPAQADIMNTRQPVVRDRKEVINYQVFINNKLLFGYNYLFQNYNKSRIHSYRGVRDIEMTLDGLMIFQGEITRACGGIVGGSEAFGEVCYLSAQYLADVLQ